MDEKPAQRRTAQTVGVALAFVLLSGTIANASCRGPQRLESQIKANPSAQNYAALAKWFGDHQEFGCAAESFRHARALEPASARYAWLEGVSLMAAARLQDALVPLQQAVQLDPRFPDAHLALASALERLNQHPEADSQWRAALDLDPNSAMALEHLSGDLLVDKQYASTIALLQPIAGANPLSPPLALNLSIAYTHTGMVDQAISLLFSALRDDPSSVPLLRSLADALLLENRSPEAVQILAKAAAQHPNDLGIQVQYARIMIIARDSNAATLAHSLLAAHPEQPELLYLNGVLCQQSGQYPEARRYLERFLQTNPADATARYRLGVVLAAMKENAEARMQLEKAIALGIDTPEAHFELANILRTLGERDAAEQQFALYRQANDAQTDQVQLTMELAPHRPSRNLTPTMQAVRAQAAAKAELGGRAEAAGNLPQAIADYRDAVTIDPQEPLLDYKLAMVLDKAGDRAGERAALEQATRIDPHMALVQNQLGYLDSREGNPASAVEHFRLAVQAYPGYTTAWMNLAAALCLESRWQEAKEALNHVLELDPGNTAAKELMQRIETLQPTPEP
jgi:tetratricopeptide (TPR) repeat protein